MGRGLKWIWGVVLVSLSTIVGGYLLGVFGEYLPTPKRLICEMQQAESGAFPEVPIILFAPSTDDAFDDFASIGAVIHKRLGVETITVCERFRLTDYGAASNSRGEILSEAKELLKEHDGSALIWGGRKGENIWVGFATRSDLRLDDMRAFAASEIADGSSELYQVITGALIHGVVDNRSLRGRDISSVRHERALDRLEFLYRAKNELADEQRMRIEVAFALGKGRLARFQQTDAELEAILNLLNTVALKTLDPAHRAQIAQVTGDVLRARWAHNEDLSYLRKAIASYDVAVSKYATETTFQSDLAETLISRASTRVGIALMTRDASLLDQDIEDIRTALDLIEHLSPVEHPGEVSVAFGQLIDTELTKADLRSDGTDALVIALEVKGDLLSDAAAYKEALSLVTVEEGDRDILWASDARQWARIARKSTFVAPDQELRARADALEMEVDEFCKSKEFGC